MIRGRERRPAGVAPPAKGPSPHQVQPFDANPSIGASRSSVVYEAPARCAGVWHLRGLGRAWASRSRSKSRRIWQRFEHGGRNGADPSRMHPDPLRLALAAAAKQGHEPGRFAQTTRVCDQTLVRDPWPDVFMRSQAQRLLRAIGDGHVQPRKVSVDARVHARRDVVTGAMRSRRRLRQARGSK